MEQNPNVKTIKVLILNNSKIMEKKYDMRNTLYSFNEVLNQELKNNTQIIFSFGQQILHRDLALNQLKGGNFKFIQGFITTNQMSEYDNEQEINVPDQNHIESEKIQQQVETEVHKQSDQIIESIIIPPQLVKQSEQVEQSVKPKQIAEINQNIEAKQIVEVKQSVEKKQSEEKKQSVEVKRSVGKSVQNSQSLSKYLVYWSQQEEPKQYKTTKPNTKLLIIKQVAFQELMKNPTLKIDEYTFAPEGEAENLERTLDSYGENPKFYLKKIQRPNSSEQSLKNSQEKNAQINYTLQFGGKFYNERADKNLKMEYLKQFHFENLIKNQNLFVNIQDFEFKLKDGIENLEQTLDEIKHQRITEEIVFVIEKKQLESAESLREPSVYYI